MYKQTLTASSSILIHVHRLKNKTNSSYFVFYEGLSSDLLPMRSLLEIHREFVFIPSDCSLIPQGQRSIIPEFIFTAFDVPEKAIAIFSCLLCTIFNMH